MCLPLLFGWMYLIKSEGGGVAGGGVDGGVCVWGYSLVCGRPCLKTC